MGKGTGFVARILTSVEKLNKEVAQLDAEVTKDLNTLEQDYE